MKNLIFVSMFCVGLSFGQVTQTCGSSAFNGCGVTFNTASGTLTSGTLGWTDGRGWAWPDGMTSGRETRPAMKNRATLQQVKLSGKPLTKDHLAPLAYVSLAKSIGLESAATDEARLVQAIADCELPVYDFEKVDNYLYHETLKMKIPTKWVWKALRESDIKPVGYSSWVDGFGMLFGRQYTNKIPEATLAAVAKVLAKVPDAVFLVSDYETIKPDPFLAVSTAKLLDARKLWIISQWDEPGFGEDMPGYKLGFTPVQ